jgi:hypothetical protein
MHLNFFNIDFLKTKWPQLNNAHSGDASTADHPKAKFVESFGKNFSGK